LVSMHTVEKLSSLTFPQPAPFYEAMCSIFTPVSTSGWVLVGYTSERALCLQGRGNKVEELVANLKDNEVQYMLVRVQVEDALKKLATTRDIFINWTGPQVGIVAKGKKKAHVGELKLILQPHHAELTAVSKRHFNLKTIITKSEPLSGSHVIDDIT